MSKDVTIFVILVLVGGGGDHLLKWNLGSLFIANLSFYSQIAITIINCDSENRDWHDSCSICGRCAERDTRFAIPQEFCGREKSGEERVKII